MSRGRIRLPVISQRPDDTLLSDVRGNRDHETVPRPANEPVNFLEVGGLVPVELARLDEVVCPKRDVERFLEVHADIAEGKRVGAVLILKPTFEDGHDRPARSPYHLRRPGRGVRRVQPKTIEAVAGRSRGPAVRRVLSLQRLPEFRAERGAQHHDHRYKTDSLHRLVSSHVSCSTSALGVAARLRKPHVHSNRHADEAQRECFHV